MRSQHGLTLIEVMVVLVIIGILASIALPSYQNYATKSRAKAAAADLTSLAAAVESRFQRTLGYPANATGTDNVKGAFSQWSPSKADFFDFNYVAPVNGSTYILQADGKGAMAGCILKLHGDNTARTATAACKMGTTW